MNILVLGGAGFLGSHVVDALLQNGHNVQVVDLLMQGNKLSDTARQAVALHVIDGANHQDVLARCERADVIINLASIVGVDVVARKAVAQMENEIELVRASNLLSMAFDDCPIVYASTSAVYGTNQNGVAVQEFDSCNCHSSYAVAKLWGEHFLKTSSRERGSSVAVIRPFNLYGPRQDTRMVIPRMCESAVRGEALMVLGNGEQTRDFTWVLDAAQGVANLCESIVSTPVCASFNVCTGKETTIAELARMVIAAADSTSELKFVPVPEEREAFEVERRFGNPTAWHEKTSFVNATELHQGLPITVAYTRSVLEKDSVAV